MISRLEHYREQAWPWTRASSTKRYFRSHGLGQARLIQSHLRDRLFEISRRNRLIYFKPTLQTLNSPSHRFRAAGLSDIKLEQLFVWHRELAATVTEGRRCPWANICASRRALHSRRLDKIISEARRDRAEYGFAQLRLVLCFLRWNNSRRRSTSAFIRRCCCCRWS